MEGTEDQRGTGWWRGGVEGVETGPIDVVGGGGGRKGGVGVVKKG